MDGARREADLSRNKSQQLVDLGQTPPWSLPAQLHEESALRSTLATVQQHAVAERTAAPASGTLDQGSDVRASPLEAREAINDPGFQQPEVNGEDHDNDTDVYVDRKDDFIYHENSGRGSWSATLDSEEDPVKHAKVPPQAELAVTRIKLAQERVKEAQTTAREAQHVRAANAAVEALLQTTRYSGRDLTPDETAKWQKDLHLRNTMRQFKARLQAGADLILLRMDPVNQTSKCRHPYCPAPNKLIPGGAYYLFLVQCPTPNRHIRFCLSCLEGLWNGTGLAGELPDPDVHLPSAEPDHKVSNFNLDGAMDEIETSAVEIRPSTAITSSSSFSSPTTISRPSSAHSESTLATTYSDPVSDSAKRQCHPDPAATHPFSQSSLSQESQTSSQEEEGHASESTESFAEKTRNTSLLMSKTSNISSESCSIRRSPRLQSKTSVDPDLLAKTAKCLRKLPLYETAVSRRAEAILREPHLSPSWSHSVDADRWCICYGVEDERKMILCENKHCLVGWYHVECVEAAVDKDEEWWCPLCTSQQGGDCILPFSNTKALLELVDLPYADLIAKNIYGAQEPPTSSTRESTAKPYQADQPASLPQLDGAPEFPLLSYQPPKPSPLGQSPLQFPHGLLASQHAPSAEQLASEQSEETRAQPSTPSIDDLRETPGLPSPSTSPDSMTSTGEWRRPMQRSQHLAKFIKPDYGLEDAEIAAVEVWKNASEEQVRWNNFRWKYAKTLEELNALSNEDEGEEDVDVLEFAIQLSPGEVYILDDGEIGDHNEAAETVGEQVNAEPKESLGLSKKNCYGKNLSVVLAEVRSSASK